MHQQLCTHCGTLPIPRHWSSQKNLAFSHCLLVTLQCVAHAEITLRLVQHLCMCRSASSVDILILVCFVCIQPNGHRSPLLDQNEYIWPRLALSGRQMGLVPTSVSNALSLHVLLMWLISLPSLPNSLICWLARGMELSTPCGQALSLSGSLFRDPTLQVLSAVVVAFSTCSIPSLWRTSPFSVNSSRHLKGFVSFSYRSAPTSLFRIRSERWDPRPWCRQKGARTVVFCWGRQLVSVTSWFCPPLHFILIGGSCSLAIWFQIDNSFLPF